MFNAFHNSMLDCEIIRNNTKIATYKGLINDTKDYNMICFEPNPEPNIKIGDDIYCPMKKKHYLVTNIDINTFNGQPHSFDVYFENNFSKPISTVTFNTYNPTSSIIGNQQYATLNITESFNNLDNLINSNGGEDKTRLNELSSILKFELSSNQINRTKLSQYSDLIAKHSWLFMAITQIIAAWIQRG